MNTPSGYPYNETPPQPVRPVVANVAPPQSGSQVTYAIIAVTVVVYLAQMLSQSLFQGEDLPFDYLGKINEFILQGQVWRLITPIFVHASILHIGFNMYALFVLGRGLERVYGHGRFALLYFLSGFAGNVASFFLTPNPSLGASTAIFGLVVAQGVFVFHNRKLFGSQHTRSALINTGVIVLINLGIGLQPGSGIDNWGHVGGFLGGLLFTWLGGPLWQIEGVAPFYRVVDQREESQVQLAVLAVLVVFGGIAALRFFIH